MLTIEQKLELTAIIDKGSSRKQMCSEYGIGEATVRDILQQKDYVFVFSSTLKVRKEMKPSLYKELDKVLF